jgi:hypothetical protein
MQRAATPPATRTSQVEENDVPDNWVVRLALTEREMDGFEEIVHEYG